MNDQRLPLPLGGRFPARRLARVFRGRLGRLPLLSLGGLVAGLAGAVLAIQPPATRVALDGDGYHVGPAVLGSRGGGVYAGEAGAVVIVEGPTLTRAGASTHVDGVPATGRCELAGRSERCSFVLAGRRLDAIDRLRDGGWDRSYGDGRTARIELAGGRPVPVPFPLGR